MCEIEFEYKKPETLQQRVEKMKRYSDAYIEFFLWAKLSYKHSISEISQAIAEMRKSVANQNSIS